MSTFSYTILIPAIPLFLFLLIGLTGHKFKPLLSGIIGTAGLGFITLLSYYTAIVYFWGSGRVESVNEAGELSYMFQTIIPHNFEWLTFSP